MVKNSTGGNKAKGFARKGASSNEKKDKPLRVSENEFEVYAIIEKINGNGMCDVMCMDGEIRLLHIRGKFRGRGKRDNVIDKTSWLLVGIRDYETVKEGKKQNCDLLEVYNSSEKDKLKLTVTNVNWKNFISKDNIINNIEILDEDQEIVAEGGGFVFADQQQQEYNDLMEKLKTNKDENTVVSVKEEDWIDMNEL
jgi:initiation factor 1A